MTIQTFHQHFQKVALAAVETWNSASSVDHVHYLKMRWTIYYICQGMYLKKKKMTLPRFPPPRLLPDPGVGGLFKYSLTFRQ